MLPNLCRVLAEFKTQGSQRLGTDEELEQLCREMGLTWRERKLTPVRMLRLFFLQILHGNLACEALPRIAGFSFTPSAYCTARQRLPIELFQRLLAQVTAQLSTTRPLATADRWRGHRVYIADATGASLPDTPPLQSYFGQVPNQKPGCGFPVAFCLILMHYGSGLIQGLRAAPLRTNELSMTPQLLGELEAGDVILGDSAFGEYVYLALLAQRGALGVFRLAGPRIVDFTPHRPHFGAGCWQRGTPRSRWRKQLGQCDQIVDWFKPSQRPDWLSPQQWASLPEVLPVRELRYRIEKPGFRVQEITLVTTLLDPQRYPLEALANLFGQRWTMETNLRHLKITLGMDILHCQTVAGVQKELLMFCLLYNLVRGVMGFAAQTQHVSLARISFIDALRWLLYDQDWDHDPMLLTRPLRPPRIEPRVIKRRAKRYPLLTRPRTELRKSLARKLLLAK